MTRAPASISPPSRSSRPPQTSVPGQPAPSASTPTARSACRAASARPRRRQKTKRASERGSLHARVRCWVEGEVDVVELAGAVPEARDHPPRGQERSAEGDPGADEEGSGEDGEPEPQAADEGRRQGHEREDDRVAAGARRPLDPQPGDDDRRGGDGVHRSGARRATHSPPRPSGEEERDREIVPLPHECDRHAGRLQAQQPRLRPGDAVGVDERHLPARDPSLDEPVDERRREQRRDDDQLQRAEDRAGLVHEERLGCARSVRLGRREQLERAAAVALGRGRLHGLGPDAVHDQHGTAVPARVREQDRAGGAHLQIEDRRALCDASSRTATSSRGASSSSLTINRPRFAVERQWTRRERFALLEVAHAVQVEAARPVHQLLTAFPGGTRRHPRTAGRAPRAAGTRGSWRRRPARPPCAPGRTDPRGAQLPPAARTGRAAAARRT